ncbi:3-hydroxy-3-methylglutaryl-coenzyme A reductase [Neolecta irregularis DAH-3]|uniref:hydroxymethylglutaryl-CoA reductase (NADPH) n=1 Tax=Neolecta irregularis (strain DAH-3) TaxID=1198029 RepID=A0A1U7LLM3_NEOID|nr:3-hydroxy-3-methylglutaryl-coenzyme A reductase [Neolecta irregularis DAH-3]|eukprot:OLL23539.1 3-hydroxy-3-methylglutaryl-coenzyme A reductase [Neolecta irregularis DAH-3]
MKGLLSALASGATASPIHIIAFYTLLASAAYFHLLDLAKDYAGQSAEHQDLVMTWRRGTVEKGDIESLLPHISLAVFDLPSGHSYLPLVLDTLQPQCYTPNNSFSCISLPIPPGKYGILLEVPELDTLALQTNGIEVNHPSKDPVSLIWMVNSISQLAEKTRNLIHNAERADIAIMAVAYISMYLTFVSLFLNMRNLNSRFWLGTTILISSTFAFLFALVTTHHTGIIIDPIVLTEGLPFLVVTVGFDKPFALTKAVLNGNTGNIKTDVIEAVKSKGLVILRDYAVETGILVLGALSGVSGLRHFCALAAWILVWDCLLLFTFYTAVLAIKLEINRIKYYTNIRKALEEDGISHKTADKIVSARQDDPQRDVEYMFFFSRGRVREGTVTRFKSYMVAGWVFVNVFNLLPTRRHSFTSEPLDLEEIIESVARLSGLSEFVLSILPTACLRFGSDRLGFLHVFLESWTRSVGDPVISKWIVLTLGISVGLNAWLFNAARWHIQKPVVEQETPRHPMSKLVVGAPEEVSPDVTESQRTDAECEKMVKLGTSRELLDEELVRMMATGIIAGYSLEKILGDPERAVRIRRAVLSRNSTTRTLETSELPYRYYDYSRVIGACCENVIGYMPIPVGVAGPMMIDCEPFLIPMATTEGCLVASTMRGCKAINASGGAITVLMQDQMTRGPCVMFPSLSRAAAAKFWLDSDEGQRVMQKAFDSTSRFARLKNLKTAIAGIHLYIRFATSTGDAMGMNMISKGAEHALSVMKDKAGFSDMSIVSISGNYCTDKKPAAINWIEGRGKSVVAEALIPGQIIKTILKSSVDSLVELNIAKNLVGSAMAGNPAQNIESSNCITLMRNVNGNLHITVSMPSIEVGTIGGGTVLEPQGAMLDLLGIRGPHPTSPGRNSQQLARIVAAAVLAGELSLCSALAAGHLVKSHMILNRSQANTPSPISSSSTTAPGPLNQSPGARMTPIRSIPGSCLKS